MQEFNTEDYEFRVDGEVYSLPEMNLDDFAALADIYKIKNPIEQVEAFRNTLMRAADERTAPVIQKMGIKKVGALFREWSGIGGTPGE